MTSSPPTMGPLAPHPKLGQSYSVQPASDVPHPFHPHGHGFVYQQNQEPTMMATESQPQGPTGIQKALGGQYHQQSSPSRTVMSSHAGSFSPVLPVSSRPLGLTGELSLPPQVPSPQRFSRKRKALIIGINYTFHPNRSFRQYFCHEDAYSMANFLHSNLGFSREDIRIMTDETNWNLPTKANILREMRTLVHDAQPHDSFFFYFSGHACQIIDLDGDEADGLDECICAIDYRDDDPKPNSDTPGIIVDDIMHEIMVKPLPLQCHLTALFDCSHSGTLLDLPYLYDTNGVVKEFSHPNRLAILRMKSSYADVVSLSACKDNQNALETSRGGLLQLAFIECMTAFGYNITYKQLLWNIREYIKRNRFPQRPQLSSSHEIDVNLPFIV